MNAIQLKLLTFWRERNARERLFLTVCGAVLAAAFCYAVLWAPASAGRDKLARQVPQLEAQLAQMQRQIAQLKGASAPRGNGDLRGSVQGAIAQSGITAELRPLSADALQIVAPTSSFEQVLLLLDALQGAGRIAKLEVKSAGAPGQVTATLELQR
ncbi:type II secretion system protein GspM [Chitinolyticbacter albus]|uniref:type II secretion system protein GspM n=1 Tax=Chitinolyticbacter albus TaxID=2961951 RepID=UPI002109FCC8|nr:type II secretion system protein GspM [Chitinolyticbacter albus]